MPEVVDVTELPTLKGKDIGASRWMTVTQEQINTFARLTGDEQWIHVDPQRAAASPRRLRPSASRITGAIRPSPATSTAIPRLT